MGSHKSIHPCARKSLHSETKVCIGSWQRWVLCRMPGTSEWPLQMALEQGLHFTHLSDDVLCAFSSSHRPVVVGQQPYLLKTTQQDAPQCHGSRADYLLLVGWYSLPLTKSLARQYLPFWKNICSGWRGCIPRCAWETPPQVLQCVTQATAAKIPDLVLQGWIQTRTSMLGE